MKKICHLISVIVFAFNSYTYCQLNSEKLKSTVQLTMQDLVEIKLDILAVKISSGSYLQPDIGEYRFPIDIYLNSDNKVIFEIEKGFPDDLNITQLRENIRESFILVIIGINDLMNTEFKELKFNSEKSLIGYWRFPNDPELVASWEKDKFKFYISK